MIYIFGILLLIAAFFILRALLPAEVHKYLKWYWLGLFSGFIYGFITNPYRVERVISDIKHLVN